MRSLLLFACLALPLWPQSVESFPFRAVLSPRNEVPALNLRASGTSTVWLRVTRNAQGQINGGQAEFVTRYDFAGTAVNVTGLHIHRGASGVNGPSVLDSSLAGPVAGPAGTLSLRVPLPAETAEEILANPAGFYVNLRTSANPGGALRGQLIAADKLVFLSRITPAKVVPPVTGLDAAGVAAVTLLGARDGQGRLVAAEVFFDLDYAGFPADTRFTGLHIHAGNSQVRGPVTINATLASPTPGPGGAGSLRYAAEINLEDPAQLNTIAGLYQSPQNFYADLHTAAQPAGAIRGQLQRADAARFSVSLSPRQEVPALDLDASAEASLTLHSLRSPEGSAVAGLAEFEVHARFPAGTVFTGLHVHNGRAGENGPVAIDSGVREQRDAVLFERAVVQTPAAVAALDSALRHPDRHYVNLHTSANPAGAVRAQFGAPPGAPPALTNIISAVWDPALRRGARNGLVTLFGRQLTQVSGAATGTEQDRLPLVLNGTSVTIAGRPAPVLQAEPGFVIAQVPNETPLGAQPVRVTAGNGESNTLELAIDAAAPALFFDSISAQGPHAAILKQDRFLRFTAVGPQNPARPGDVLVFYGTGFGIANARPPATGALPAGEPAPRVAVTIGGRPAPVIYALYAPGLAGLCQVAVTMPVGAGAGFIPLVLRVGGASSNIVYLEAAMR